MDFPWPFLAISKVYGRKGRNFVFRIFATEFSPPPRRLSRLAGLQQQNSAISDYLKGIAAFVVRSAPRRACLEWAAAHRRHFAPQVALLSESGDSRLSSAKRLDSLLPRRPGAVTATRPKRSGGAAQPIDGDGAAWPVTIGDLVRCRRNWTWNRREKCELNPSSGQLGDRGDDLEIYAECAEMSAPAIDFPSFIRP